MRSQSPNYTEEFRELTEDLSDAVQQMADPVSIATMLYTIAEEKKSNNLVVRGINSKFDLLVSKLDRITELLENLSGPTESHDSSPAHVDISERDQEILDFVRTKMKVCADDVQNHFKYKGRNAASARLNKLFREKRLEKVYAGRNVYYTIKD